MPEKLNPMSRGEEGMKDKMSITGKNEKEETELTEMSIEEFGEKYFNKHEKIASQTNIYEKVEKIMEIIKEGRDDLGERKISVNFGDISVSGINSLLKEITNKMNEDDLDPRFINCIHFPGTREGFITRDREKQLEAIEILNSKFDSYKDGDMDIIDFRYQKGWSLKIEKITEEGENLGIEDILKDIREFGFKRTGVRGDSMEEVKKIGGKIGGEQDGLRKKAIDLLWDRMGRTKVNLKLEFKGA